MEHRGRKNNPNTIPPRWLYCPRKASDLIVGKFLAFKTPLGPQYDDQIPEECRFHPSMLLSSMSSYKVKIGLWIDLTNTTRFYDKGTVEAAGIKYVKLQCRGHGECPSEEQTRVFIDICSNFISKNPLEVIGIHCTHGFNRTGFLITSYLVENLSWSVEAALREFSRSRTPGIYKEDYLRELFTRYGDPAETPPPPSLPDWCTEFDDTVDDDGNTMDNGKQSDDTFEPTPRRRKEYNKKNPTFMDGVKGVIPISTQPKLLQIQRKCQTMCDWKSSGFPGSQPVSLDWNNLALLNSKSYKVSWKADGTRYMMLIDGENEVYFIDRDNCVFQVSNLRFPRRKRPLEHISDTLLDGEMVIDKVESQPYPRYLVYDIIKFEGLEVGKTDFDRRMLCINKEIIGVRNQAIQERKIDKSTEPFGVRAKQFFDVLMTKELLGDKFVKQLSHEIDGLIFQPTQDGYIPGRCMEVLKWKPPSLNSVDFKLLIVKEQQEGMIPATKGYLYVGGHDNPLGEIKLNKELRKLDKKIIECTFENNQWKFLRERTDKSFPNSYDTAIAVCKSIRQPVTKERLLDFIEHHRYKGTLQKRPSNGPDSKLQPKIRPL